jgi:hypothetical protein
LLVREQNKQEIPVPADRKMLDHVKEYGNDVGDNACDENKLNCLHSAPESLDILD